MSTFSYSNKNIQRAVQGAFAAFAAPLGWLLIRYLQGADILLEIELNIGLFSYMLFGTIFAFSSFGWFVGDKERLLELVALRDSLTGLYNVRYFRESLNSEIISARRQKTPLTLIYFDLDHFKKVNDTYGHASGDQMLVAVSQAASNVLRKNEVLARVGGEEFACLLPNCEILNAKETAERLRVSISLVEIVTDVGDKVSITVSLGVACLADKDDSESFYARADKALYKAKSNGRNQVQIICDN